MDREDFIATYRKRLGCKSDGVCWCKVCSTLDKIWDNLKIVFADRILNKINMLNKNLKVKIPKKFKKQLIARFSVSNVKRHELSRFSYLEDEYEITISCPLCEKYKKCYYGNCGECPFHEFHKGKIVGCSIWLEKILDTNVVHDSLSFGGDRISWSLKKNKQARKLLKKLKTQAKKYIEWV